MGGTCEAVNPELPRERIDRPSRAALVGFYQALGRIAQEHRHPHDEAALATRPDPERPGLLKAQEPKPQPLEAM